jgi:hypothetical protein
MIQQIAWPVSDGQFRLWADIFLVWSTITYLRNDNTLQLGSRAPQPGKGDRLSVDLWCSIAGFAATALWAIGSGCQWHLATAVFFFSLAFPAIRRLTLRLGFVQVLPVLELAFPVFAGFMLANIIGAKAKAGIPDLILWPLTGAARSAIPLYASAILFITRGGTHFVKSMCATGKILPRTHAAANVSAVPSADQSSTDDSVDQIRLGMGRKLGNLERILLLIFVLASQYEALGFVLAAKGLIRSKEFEDRDFTEYFLLGSLASVLVAVLTGQLLSFVTR